MNLQHLIRETINELPDEFTSGEFNNLIIAKGYSRSRIEKKGLGKYLHRYADNYGKYSKTWIKKRKYRKEYSPDDIEVNNMKYQFDNIEEIIDFVKSKGFKVMKPVSEWVEC